MTPGDAAARLEGLGGPTDLVGGERANGGLHAHVESLVLTAAPARSVAILDLGCGTGAFLQRLAAHGYDNLTGLDIAPPAAGRAGGPRWIAGDLDTHWPLPDDGFDLVVAIEVIEHLENPGIALAELARVLRPGAIAILTTPNVHSLEARLRWLLAARLKQFDDIGDPTHVSPMFLHPFRRLAARHGLDVVEASGHPLDGGSPTSRAALRTLARVARWCGLRGAPAGDQLLVRLRRSATSRADPARKAETLTAHYGQVARQASASATTPGASPVHTTG